MNRARGILRLALLAAAGCQGRYSALDRAGPEATRVTSLHWWMFWICSAVSAAIVAALAVALVRPAGSPTPDGERQRTRAIVAATAVSTLLLFVFLVASVWAGRAIVTPAGPGSLEIQIVGHQWWWEVRYPGPSASAAVTTANEIHVPVGRPVRLLLSSGDVIHSFWAPNLNGKKDLIPGRPTVHLFRADRPGVFEGRCAEFCGYQHAHMGFLVIAEPAAEFQAWLEAQRRPAAEPSDPATRHGRQVFLASPCVVCHTIRGEGAFGHKAPDLTHLASRRTIAADTLPNTAGYLAGWVLDSQRAKPGNRMPPNVLSADDLLDLVSYLGALR